MKIDKKTTMVEIGYGFLWLSRSYDKRIIEARKMVLEGMDKEAQKRGITAAKVMLARVVGE